MSASAHTDVSSGSLLRRQRAGAVQVAPDGQGWRHITFEALHLPAGTRERRLTGNQETALVVLGGSATIQVAGGPTFENVGGRRDVWSDSRPSGVVLLPAGLAYEVVALNDDPLHLAIAGARARSSRAPRQIRPDDVRVEQRGEGQTIRRVHHLLPPGAEADRLILFEVFTPGGNWSSFPPHKHDTHDPPHETDLEELYYYGVNPSTGFALQRVYTADRSLDACVAAQDGDLVLVPRGYHTVAATPGHDCYYLNVMAGVGREWIFTVDPDYAGLMNWTNPTAR